MEKSSFIAAILRVHNRRFGETTNGVSQHAERSEWN
jgi:hypothetical protein